MKTVNRLIKKEDAINLHALHSQQKYEEAGERKQYNFDKEKEASETFYSFASKLGLDISEAEKVSWFVWSNQIRNINLPDVLNIEVILEVHERVHA